MITSTGNARIRELVRMKKSAKERKVKDAFIVEGPKMFREIPAKLLQEVYVAESFQGTGAYQSLRQAQGLEDVPVVKYARGSKAFRDVKDVQGAKAFRDAEDIFGVKVSRKNGNSPVPQEHGSKSRKIGNSQGSEKQEIIHEIVSDSVFQYLSDTRNPQGILAVVKQLHYELDDLFGETPLIIILENVQDPGNLGTILRTAEAAGVTGILMTEGCADIYNPKVTRSTMGSIFRVPFVYTSDLAGSLAKLKNRGVKLYASHLHGSEDLYTQSYTGPSAFLVGNESRGLTDETAAQADKAVRIAMSGEVESLNAAIASAVMMFEAKRQRSAG